MNYFEESEFNCGGEPCFDMMNDKFVTKLELARSYSRLPFVITSSWRSKEHNKAVGGSDTSSHLRGVAVDISTPTSSDKYSILKALLRVFSRIGVGSNFIHVDADYSKAQNVVWTY